MFVCFACYVEVVCDASLCAGVLLCCCVLSSIGLGVALMQHMCSKPCCSCVCFAV